MARSPLTCLACSAPLPWSTIFAPGPSPCPRCRRAGRSWVFPALVRPAADISAADTAAADEATCFYHPHKTAAVVCEACGRFVCTLCDVELAGRHLCPSCLEGGRRKGKIVDLEHHRMLYDSLALTLAAAPLLLWPFTFLTAPAAAFVAVRHWKSPTSILGRTKLRLVAALLLASLQILGWGALIYLAVAS